MKSNRARLVGALVGATLVVALCCSSPNQASSSILAAKTGTVTIGSLQSLTGPDAQVGTTAQAGLQVAVNDVNKAGGFLVGGTKYKIKLATVDAESTATGVTAGATQLIHDDKVQFIFGDTPSITAIPEQVTTSEAGVVYFTTSFSVGNEVAGLSPATPAVKKYTYGAGATTASSDAASVAGVLKAVPSAKSVAIVWTSDSAETSIIDTLTKKFEQKGVTVKTYLFPITTTDFSSILTQVKAQHPDVVFAGISGQQIGAIALQMVNLGMNPKLLFGSGGSVVTGTTGDSGKPLPYPYAYIVPGGVDPSVKTPKVSSFFKAVQKVVGGSATSATEGFAGFYWAPLMDLVAAMKAAGSVSNVPKIQAELAKVSVPGLVGTFRYNSKHLAQIPVDICTVKAGIVKCSAVPGGSS